MKYRQLTYKELTVMQEDFSDFLYTQGFSRFDWRVLQDQHSEQAVNLLGEYSDQTFDKVMQSIEYLEYRTPKVLYAYHCQKEQMEIIGLQAPTSSELDFTSMLSLDETNCSEIMAYKSFVHLKPYPPYLSNAVTFPIFTRFWISWPQTLSIRRDDDFAISFVKIRAKLAKLYIA